MTAAPPTFRRLPGPGRAYLAFVFTAAIATVVGLSLGQPRDADLVLLGLAIVLCTAAGAFEVLAPGNFSFQPSLVFFFWGAVLLPPWAMAPLAAASMAPGWLRHRFRWYMPAFNTANYLLTGAAALVIAGLSDDPARGAGPVGRLAAAAVFAVVLNHLLLVGVISLTQGRSPRDCVMQLRESMPLDLALATTGAALAELWLVSPELAVFAAGPMVLIHQALWVPTLRLRSRTDAKTGLFHSGHFRQEVADALSVVRRDGGTLAMIMFDLDHLRVVNNRFGHLAGDDLIEAMARLVSDAAGHDGIGARFGGEEFSLLLPGATQEQAHVVADAVRMGLEEQEWTWGDGRPFIATVSAGVSEYPANGASVDALIAAADAALYDAKLGGRNRVRSAVPDDARTSLHDGALGTPALAVVPAPPVEGAPRVPPAVGLGPVSDEMLLLAQSPTPAVPPAEEPVAPGEGGPRRGRIPWLVAAQLAVVGFIAAGSGYSEIQDQTALFILLIASMLVLERVAIDLFDRAHISPASVPALALAFIFGPLGPLAAEVVSASIRVARRESALKASFDMGSLGLAGCAAAGVYATVGGSTPAAILAASVLGGLAYYVVNASTLALVMAMAEGEPLRRVFAERLAWLWPHYLGFGLTAGAFAVVEGDHGIITLAFFGAPLFILWIAEQQYVDRSRDSVNELRKHRDELQGANRQLRGALATNEQLLQTMQRTYLSTITSLARTIEAKDPYTGGHTERVAKLALLFAEELGMSETDLRAVEVGAVIHDIGKIGIADQILTKPGRLTDEEFEVMRRHPEISSYIVSELELPPIVKQMVRSHHERFDGKGYPDALTGEEIPLAARILAVADALDAMTSDRSYRAALPLETAVQEIVEKSGSQFCPRVVAGFLACLERDATLAGNVAPQGPALKTA
jgi:diguanylate cyclase (GGDEF)-like protein/putative nucleotidyltransferase with HDIG domain